MVNVNKKYCQDLLDNDNKKAVLNGMKAIKDKRSELETDIGKLVNTIETFKELEDEYTVKELEETLTIKENWLKSLKYHYPLIALHYNDL